VRKSGYWVAVARGLGDDTLRRRCWRLALRLLSSKLAAAA
jgi:hypothetical protein